MSSLQRRSRADALHTEITTMKIRIIQFAILAVVLGCLYECLNSDDAASAPVPTQQR